jgi:hypothetical protein
MDFGKWIYEAVKAGVPDNAAAFCFNLYESDDDNKFDVQLIASPSFDENDSDWACEECFTTGEELYTVTADDWEGALETVGRMIEKLVSEKELPAVFDNRRIAYGFVDGDLYIVRET